MAHTLLCQLHLLFPLAFSEAQLRGILRVRGYRPSSELLHRTLIALLKNSQVEVADGMGPPRYRLRPMVDDSEGQNG